MDAGPSPPVSPAPSEPVIDMPDRFDRFDSYSYYPGPANAYIRHINRFIDQPNSVNIIEVDLAKARVMVSPRNRGSTVSEVAARNEEAVVVMNGGHFCPRAVKTTEYAPGRCPPGGRYMPAGISVSNGTQWPGTHDYPVTAYAAFGEGRVEFHREADDMLELEPWMKDVISGGPMLVYNGEVTPQAGSFHNADERTARSAIGISANMKTLYIIMVDDGNPTRSIGIRLLDFAEYLKDVLGVHHAMALGYGGAVSIYGRFESGGRLLNRPSEGSEWELADHILIFGRE